MLQMLVEPAGHVLASFLRGLHGERVSGVVSAGETMGNPREDLHHVVDLQPQNKLHMHRVLDHQPGADCQKCYSKLKPDQDQTRQLKLQTHRLVLLQDTLKLLYQLWRRTSVIFASEYRDVAFDLCASDKIKSEKKRSIKKCGAFLQNNT